MIIRDGIIWAADYNEERPHSAVGCKTPKAFAERLFIATGAALRDLTAPRIYRLLHMRW